MQVVGRTNEREVWVGSGNRPFRLNELLILEGYITGNAIGEVVETYSLNPMVPLVDESSPFLMGEQVLNTMQAMGYQLDQDTVYLAKVRILSEMFYPVKTGSRVRLPGFSEVRHLLVKAEAGRSLALGIIMGTEELHEDLPDELNHLAPTLDQGLLVPQQGVPFLLNYRAMQDYPHIGIFGGSGSGKSFGLRVLIEEFMKQEIPLLIFDPHFEMSFDRPFDDGSGFEFGRGFGDKTILLTVGKDVGVKFDSLTEGDLVNLLSSVSPMSEAMEAAARVTLWKNDSQITYRDRLEQLISLMELGEPTFREEFLAAGGPDNEKEWKRLKALPPQVGQTASLKGILWRLHVLLREGIFQDKGIQIIEEGIRNQRAVIIRGSIRLLRVYSGYVLRYLYNRRREYRDAVQKGAAGEPFPPFVVVTDEAHNFVPRFDEKAPSRREFREAAQEGRKYGVFLVLATQRPASMDETVNAQLNNKIIFRTVRSTDLTVIREETDLSAEEIRRLPYMPSGTGFISSPVMGRTVAIRIRAAQTASPHQLNPFDELDEMKDVRINEIWPVLQEHLPLNETGVNDVLREIDRRGQRISRKELDRILEQLVACGKLIRDDSEFITVYRMAEGELS